ncbi:hypothetical protein [Halosimplex halobium]|uniref:hypothetical protein n=1 Tax=Halosimplex halobium TaxID=3396618 RepID=UPI003F568666
MTQDIPMASHLLASKVLGVSARKLAESMGPPVVPCLILYAIGLPLIITLPLVVVGVIIGAVIYKQTPPGQQPLRFAGALLRHYRGQTHYIWKPPEEGENGLVTSSPEDVWLTVVDSEDAESAEGATPSNPDPLGLDEDLVTPDGPAGTGDA